MARLPNKKISKARADQIMTARQDQAEYENDHALESTITMAFDTARNSMATINNVAMICRNKSEIKTIESIGELEQAYAKLLA